MMGAKSGKKRTSVSLSGKGTVVPPGDISHISYYMMCISSLLVYHNIAKELIDYRNAQNLWKSKQDELIAAALLFNPKDIINKLLIVDDDNVLLPQGSSNKFRDLSEVKSVIAVSSNALVGGKQTKITRIMLCKTDWITKYWITPMKGIKDSVARIANKSLQETDKYFDAVELALKSNRLSEQLGKHEVKDTPAPARPVTKHCNHCSGKKVICTCKQGCPRQGHSECTHHPHVTCNRCGRQGLVGPRFKCFKCHKFELCQGCYNAEVDGHVTHDFVRIDRDGDHAVSLPPRQVRAVPMGPPLVRVVPVRPPAVRTVPVGPPVVRTVSVGPPVIRAVPVGPPVVRTVPVEPPVVRAVPVGPPLVRAVPVGPPAVRAVPEISSVPFLNVQQQASPPPTAPILGASAPTKEFASGQKIRVIHHAKFGGCNGTVERAIPGNNYVVTLAGDGGKKVVFQAKHLKAVFDVAVDPNFPLHACVELKGLGIFSGENRNYAVIVGYQGTNQVLVKLFDDDRVMAVKKSDLTVIEAA